MKFIFSAIFSFFSLFVPTSKVNTVQSSSVKIICLYRMISRPDSTSKTTWEELTQLAISDSSSEFRSFVRYKSDSLLSKYQYSALNSPAFNEGMNEITNLPKYKFDGIVIKNSKTNNCIYYGVINKILYSYEDSNYPMNWHIVSDTASINGYNCQKATTKFGGRRYTAWFTRQIPINNGPYKFGGLPGLIISISDTTNSYKFELTRIYEPSKYYSISLPSQILFSKQLAINTTKNKYYSSYFIARDNFIDKSIASGSIKFDNEESVRKTYQDKIKRRNNPIELDYKK